jgi:23S rRNA pseudouridine2605 synthase
MSDEKGRKCVTDLVKDAPVRLFPVGRLDMNSEGLLIMTNDGDFANKLTHPSYHVNKTYRVTVKGDAEDEKIIKLKEGIVLDGKKTLPCEVFVAERKPDRTVLIFIIQEGRNRQIRRMCQSFGYHVRTLKRIRFMHLHLDVKEGQYRLLTENEINKLRNKK